MDRRDPVAFSFFPESSCAGSRQFPHALPEAAGHIGIDEAGRGCLAGPVVAAAVLFPAAVDFPARLPGLTDSKKMTGKQRLALSGPIREQAVAYGLGLSWQEEIDQVNILAATLRAMCRAVFALAAGLEENSSRGRCLPLLRIDGNRLIPEAQWRLCAQGPPACASAWEQRLGLRLPLPASIPALPEQEAVVRGDLTVPSISAASVLAKTARDALMCRLEELYPGYGFAAHKGYGTRKHCELLLRKGPCPLHRKSFRPVQTEKNPSAARQGKLLQG